MKRSLIILFSAFCIINFACSSCKVSYGFNEKGTQLADSIKTVWIDFIQNLAPYNNPQLSPALTDRLKQKVTRQTKLTQVNRDDADLVIAATVRDYSVTTTGVSSVNGQSQTTVNRLNVSVHVTITNNKTSDVKEHDVTRQFDFPARQTLQQAEAQLLDEMIRNLTDEIFNRIFSDW